ncbi:hypothetical protein CBR65_11260 [Cellvibrio sp. PSBB006]|nr:hypothetical protein CBR65_11260 [Cellvibrio sp. PSBB006]
MVSCSPIHAVKLTLAGVSTRGIDDELELVELAGSLDDEVDEFFELPDRDEAGIELACKELVIDEFALEGKLDDELPTNREDTDALVLDSPPLPPEPPPPPQPASANRQSINPR